MKINPILLIFPVFVLSTPLAAQTCLHVNILSLMSKLEVPGNAANSYASCNTGVYKENKQTYIVDYGEYVKELDTLLTQKPREFNAAFALGTSGINSQVPSAQAVDQAKQLGETIKNMTPEQQKAFAMQEAAQMMQSSGTVLQDDAATTRAVMSTYDLAVNQLGAVDGEFNSRYKALSGQESKELEQVPEPDNSHCPHPDRITELPSCTCVNELAGKYFMKKIAIEDKYDAEKISLYQSYIGKIKALVGQVDQSVAALHYGADLKSKANQRMLFSAQSTAFAGAFNITGKLITDIHKGGADLYVNKLNCDKNVYSLSCAN